MQKKLGSFELNIPDIRTQAKIIHIAEHYHLLIENNRRRIALLEESARLLYRKWFVSESNQITNHEKGSACKISEVWNIQHGKNLSTLKISNEGTFPVHGADGIIGYYEEKNVDEKLCLVTCRRNGSGNVRRTFGPTFVTNNCFIFHSTEKYRNIPFFFAILALEKLDLRQARTGAAQPQITLSNIRHLEIFVPSKEVLSKFVIVGTPIYQQIDCLLSQNQ